MDDPSASQIHSPRQAYDLLASRYASTRWYGFWRAYESPVVRRWLQAGTDVMLDLGSGNCPYLADLRDASARQILLDVSFGMAKEARKSIRRVRADRAFVMQADARRIPLASRSVGAIVCTRVLSHLPELDNVFREVARVMKPASRMLVTDVHHLHPYTHTRFELDGGLLMIETHKHSIRHVVDAALGVGLTIGRLDEYHLRDLPKAPDPVAFRKLYERVESPIFYSLELIRS